MFFASRNFSKAPKQQLPPNTVGYHHKLFMKDSPHLLKQMVEGGGTGDSGLGPTADGQGLPTLHAANNPPRPPAPTPPAPKPEIVMKPTEPEPKPTKPQPSPQIAVPKQVQPPPSLSAAPVGAGGLGAAGGISSLADIAANAAPAGAGAGSLWRESFYRSQTHRLQRWLCCGGG